MAKVQLLGLSCLNPILTVVPKEREASPGEMPNPTLKPSTRIQMLHRQDSTFAHRMWQGNTTSRTQKVLRCTSSQVFLVNPARALLDHHPALWQSVVLLGISHQIDQESSFIELRWIPSMAVDRTRLTMFGPAPQSRPVSVYL